jgi:hypothetical protein
MFTGRMVAWHGPCRRHPHRPMLSSAVDTPPLVSEVLRHNMAKRARGTTTRPGQRRPMQRPAARPGSPEARPASIIDATSPAPRPASLTPEEEARAAELEAAIVAEERQADNARRQRAQRTGTETPVRSSSPLAAAAANEYGYVARDIRRVAIVGGSLVALLLILWVATQVTGTTL